MTEARSSLLIQLRTLKPRSMSALACYRQLRISRNLKQVRRYHKPTCKDLPLLWQAQLKAVKAPQSESQYDDCHVIVLRRAGGKSVGRTKQVLQQLLGVQVRVRLRLGDHSVFPPLVF
jgi:hypothetical protein